MTNAANDKTAQWAGNQNPSQKACEVRILSDGLLRIQLNVFAADTQVVSRRMCTDADLEMNCGREGVSAKTLLQRPVALDAGARIRKGQCSRAAAGAAEIDVSEGAA